MTELNPKSANDKPQLNDNQGTSMVANPGDRVEIMLERGNVFKLTATVRLDQPSDFSAWSEKLIENLRRCPFPSAEMLDTVPMAVYCKMLADNGEAVPNDKKWTYLDGNPLEAGAADKGEQKVEDKFDKIFKSVRVDVDQRKTTRTYVYTSRDLMGRVETKENNKFREGIRQWIQSCVQGGIYSYICEANSNDSAYFDDIGDIYRRLRDIAEKPTHLDLVNLLDSLLKLRMVNDDITTYMGKVLDTIAKINKMSKLIPKTARRFNYLANMEEFWFSGRPTYLQS